MDPVTVMLQLPLDSVHGPPEKDTPPVPDMYQETVSPSVEPEAPETVAVQVVEPLTAIEYVVHDIPVVVDVLLMVIAAEVPELAP